jgi:hypothetical protein
MITICSETVGADVRALATCRKRNGHISISIAANGYPLGGGQTADRTSEARCNEPHRAALSKQALELLRGLHARKSHAQSKQYRL